MQSLLPAIFSLLVGAAGWYYMFYSNAATKLAGIEEEPVNALRIRLRRIGGFAMIVLAAAFYTGIVALIREKVATAAALMACVFVLMGIIVFLGLTDLRLTRRIKRDERRQDLQ